MTHGVIALAAASLVTACARPAIPLQHAHGDDTSQACFPSPPQIRRANEGPFARALIARARHGGLNYEVARFELPKPLPRKKRAMLMRQIETALSQRHDLVHAEAGTVESGMGVARALSLRLDGGRVGLWHLAFPTPHTMVQASVVGPGHARADAERFLATVGRGCQN